MKRFLVFAFEDYYPAGGWNDFKSDHDTQEEVDAAVIEEANRGWAYLQVVDTETTTVEHHSGWELRDKP